MKAFPEFCHKIYFGMQIAYQTDIDQFQTDMAFPIVTRVLAKLVSYCQPCTSVGKEIDIFHEFFIGWKEQLKYAVCSEYFASFIAANIGYHFSIIGYSPFGDSHSYHLHEIIVDLCFIAQAFCNMEYKRVFKQLKRVLLYSH